MSGPEDVAAEKYFTPPEPKQELREKIEQYVRGAVHMPLMDFDHLVRMVILHFDTPDRKAKKLVWQIVLALCKEASGRSRP